MSFNFSHTYTQLDGRLYAAATPTPIGNPEIVLYNAALAQHLDLGTHLTDKEWSAILSGNQVAAGAQYIAQAYAGHQFGHFATLGDGRAILMGEHQAHNGSRCDVQLKGAGTTPYSRRGDGRASLNSMLREYVMSEAMHHLGIPSTRSLAVVSGTDLIYRKSTERTAVLTRIATSHLRVGTFEYASRVCGLRALEQLCRYALQRHFPHAMIHSNPAHTLLVQVIDVQVDLVVNWLRVGFVHGVMNTDNMSICGETIDYGPCAFMHEYNPSAVFSEIDGQGRYAFGNQPNMMHWNLARFAEALLPLLHDVPAEAIALAQTALDHCVQIFENRWQAMMNKKIGIAEIRGGEEALSSQLLQWMLANKADYTNTFMSLLSSTHLHDMYLQQDFVAWKTKWLHRIGSENGVIPSECRSLMIASNPCYVPRATVLEDALHLASTQGDLKDLKAAMQVWQQPYRYDDLKLNYATARTPANYSTHCNT
jgi:serine/tyrosine/threonine adenylyltransferase